MDKYGGTTFPNYNVVMTKEGQGMTLRDYFAAKADIPWDACIDTLLRKGNKRDEITLQMLIDCRVSVKFIEADAMLKARESP